MFVTTNLNTNNRPDGQNDPLKMKDVWRLANQQCPNPMRYMEPPAQAMTLADHIRQDLDRRIATATAVVAAAGAIALAAANDNANQLGNALAAANDNLVVREAELALANGYIEQLGAAIRTRTNDLAAAGLALVGARANLGQAEVALNTMKIIAKTASIMGVVFGLGFIYEKAVNYMTQNSLKECEQDIQMAHDDTQRAMQGARLCMQELERK